MDPSSEQLFGGLPGRVLSLNAQLQSLLREDEPMPVSDEVLEACRELEVTLNSVSRMFQAAKDPNHVWEGTEFRRSSLPVRSPPDPSSNEQDFTSTHGRPSALGCPFASQTNDSLQQMPADHPRVANIEQPDTSAAALAMPDRCPIRQLGNVSPEVIADYLKDHKHELPRSHAFCVRRYQKDPESSRQLDAKYDNLVSMVQDLGERHKKLLPEDNRDRRSSGDKKPAVVQWINDLPPSSLPEDTKDRKEQCERNLLEQDREHEQSFPTNVMDRADQRRTGNL